MIEKSRTYGIDLNLLDFDGDSALYYAFENNHWDIARLMIDESKDKGIHLNQEDNHWRSKFLKMNSWVNSVGALVYGRRPDLWSWNPLIVSNYILRCYDLYFVGYNFRTALISILLFAYLAQLVFFMEVPYNSQCHNEDFTGWKESHGMKIQNQCHFRNQDMEEWKRWNFSFLQCILVKVRIEKLILAFVGTEILFILDVFFYAL